MYGLKFWETSTLKSFYGKEPWVKYKAMTLKLLIARMFEFSRAGRFYETRQLTRVSE